MFSATLCFLVCIVNARNLILVPKETEMYTLNTQYFVENYSMKTLATFDELSIYTMEDTQNINTLSNFFHIEEDQVITLNDNGNQDFILINGVVNNVVYNSEKVPWHLDRITKRHLPLNNSYPYSKSGSCFKNKDVTIHTYVIDTGIDVSHPEFEGRAEWLENFTGDGKDTDCQNHGTHCAGILASKTFGVCKDALLFAIKVLDCRGSGSLSGVIQGINYAYTRHKSMKSNVRSVVSMSLGGGKSVALNQAVETILKNSNTFYFSVAAGNENSDACNTSPGGANGVFCVMASGIDDTKAYFSNWGKCGSLYGPGVNIESTVPGGQTAVYSGTSMSGPILSGVLLHYLDQFPNLNMAQMKEKILSDATQNTITGNPKDTPNLFVYLQRND